MATTDAVTVTDVSACLERWAPVRLAESWDNVGLLVGDGNKPLRRIMTCLTVTPVTVAEAIAGRAEMIVTHHPLPFHPLQRITRETTVGGMLLDLIAAGTAIYSPHTAFDSARAGINQRLAERMELKEIHPLVRSLGEDESLGAGRCGVFLPTISLQTAARRLQDSLELAGVFLVGNPAREIHRAAVACGSGGALLAAARSADCQLLITGETSFHTCLEAEATGVSLLLPGHFASERFAIEYLAEMLQAEFPQLCVWPSRQEADPLRWMGRL